MSANEFAAWHRQRVRNHIGPMTKQIYEIDGLSFSTLTGFAGEFSQKLNLSSQWRGNLDAFNDILRGGFGTPAAGFVLRWKNSELSRQRLGYAETSRWLEERIRSGQPSTIAHFKQKLKLAQRNEGPTLFDWLIEIIQAEEHSAIELRLE